MNDQSTGLGLGRALLHGAVTVAMLLGVQQFHGCHLPSPAPSPPAPSPAPIPADGLHVLVAYESADVATYPREAWGAVYGADFEGYLNAKCAKGKDGRPAWRRFDKDTPGGGDDAIWGEAMKKATAFPWLVVSNPQKGGGYAGKLPATKAEVMALLQKYGG